MFGNPLKKIMLMAPKSKINLNDSNFSPYKDGFHRTCASIATHSPPPSDAHNRVWEDLNILFHPAFQNQLFTTFFYRWMVALSVSFDMSLHTEKKRLFSPSLWSK
ncbi:hypothetical protein NPIL_376961 [Nephila pilipes]|uniref:Uncharacterized protein n=1 Tax=Nephila pilipes TaxID=299642 RepID=A0A8X6PB82_NEPPI|nr:hypothetical protein NPIL_376961 [Nephila pilipes]